MELQLQPRQNQIEAKRAVIHEWEQGRKRTLLVMATGTGKTIVFALVAEEVTRKGGRTLVLAHRGELIEQAVQKIKRATSLGCNVEKADQSAFDDWFRITVGSVQTMMREKRLARFPRDYFQSIIVDEAHHALANSYQTILQHFSGANVLGVTATPDRGDQKELGGYFDSLAYQYQIPQAIRDGYLCRIMAQTIPLTIDLASVRQTAGDFNADDLGNALDPYLELIAEQMRQVCPHRKTVVFLPLIRTSQRMRDLLQDVGFRAAEVNGESKDRREILQAFDQGEYDVLCNSMLLTEGWDCPSVDCIVCLRPTKIRSLYCQIIGRGTRIHPGKENLLLLDFLWLSQKHDLCRPANLLSPSAAVAKKMTDILADGKPADLQETEALAEVEEIHEREAALAKRLAEMRKKKGKLVDPLQYEMSICAEDLVDYVPTFAWEMAPPTNAQIDCLEKAGIFAGEIECTGKAGLLIDKLSKRRAAGLATPKQIRFLEGRGFREVGTWEFESALHMIDRIAGNGWRTPPGIYPREYKPQQQERIEG